MKTKSQDDGIHGFLLFTLRPTTGVARQRVGSGTGAGFFDAPLLG